MAYSKNIKGIAGEVFVKKYCKENNINYTATSETQNREEGIDCYIDNIAIDIKNTDCIYFLQIDFNGTFLARHPFRDSSKATHYCFVDVNEKGDGKFKSFVPITNYLLDNYFNNAQDLESFKEALQAMNNKSCFEYGSSIEQAAFVVKKTLTPYLKNSYIFYNINRDTLQLADFKIIIKKEEIKKVMKKEEKKIKPKREVIEINL